MRFRRSSASKHVEPVEFLPVQHVFKPQIKITTLADIFGWVDKNGNRAQKSSKTKHKFHLKANQDYYVDEDTAREFIAKGYAVGDLLKPLSEDEIAEYQSEVTKVGVNSG